MTSRGRGPAKSAVRTNAKSEESFWDINICISLMKFKIIVLYICCDALRFIKTCCQIFYSNKGNPIQILRAPSTFTRTFNI